MMPEQAPTCLCGMQQWNPGVSTFSTRLQSQWFACNHCGRPAIYIGNGGGNAFIISTNGDGEFPKDGLDWINSILLLVWRDVQERLTTARDVIEDESWDAFCEREDLPQGTKISSMDKGQTKRFCAMLDELYKEDRWRQPSGFEEQDLPPQVPESVTVFHPLGDGEWKAINRSNTTDIEVPADPIRVRHDAYFDEVFAALEGELGQFERVEVKNEYCGAKNEPWYKFILGGFTFTVGPRKRVIAIKVDAPGGIDTESIRSVARADKTTYTADGGWQSNAAIANAIEVHAWTKEKLILYLTILGRASAAVPA